MIKNGQDRSVLVGRIFENLAVHLFGGEITDNRPRIGNLKEVGKIDITDSNKKRLIEVKSSNHKDRFVILHRQFKLQQNLVKGKYSQIDLFLGDTTSYELYHMFFSYKTKRLYSFGDNYQELEDSVKNSIDYLIITSFDIVEAMFKNYEIRTKTQWEDHIEFKRKNVKEMLDNYKTSLSSLGLNEENYEFRENILSNEKTNKFKTISIINNNYKQGDFIKTANHP